MTKQQFYAEIETILEMDPGSITGSEALSELESWDSLAVLSFMAMADTSLGVLVPASELAKCRTVPDLVNLFPGKIAD
jgi:acyl carrier protein